MTGEGAGLSSTLRPTLEEAIFDTRFLVPFVAQKPCASLYDLVSIYPFCIPSLDFLFVTPDRDNTTNTSTILLYLSGTWCMSSRGSHCAAGLLSPRLSGMITLTPLSCSGRPFPTVARGRYIYMAPLHDVSEILLNLFSVAIAWFPFALSPSALTRR